MTLLEFKVATFTSDEVMRNFTPADHDGRTISPSLARALARSVSLSSATIYAHDRICCKISSHFVVTCLLATAHRVNSVTRMFCALWPYSNMLNSQAYHSPSITTWRHPPTNGNVTTVIRQDHPRGHAYTQVSGRQPLAFQPRRAAHFPLLSFEVHPGEAIYQLTTSAHLFAIPPPLTQPMHSAIEFSARPTHEVRAWRSAKFDEWRQRAIDLRQQSIYELLLLLDERLRKLWLNLRGLDPPPSTSDLKLDDFLHIALRREVHTAAGSSDQTILDSTLRGFAVVGDIQRGNVWQPHPRYAPPVYTEQQLEGKAWTSNNVSNRNSSGGLGANMSVICGTTL